VLTIEVAKNNLEVCSGFSFLYLCTKYIHMSKKIVIINGPNLNLLGNREPNIYGNQSFGEYFKQLQTEFQNDVDFEYFQSNVEGELINKIQEYGFETDGIILNAGGYTHTSIAIADAVRAIETPVVEVHISNIDAREGFRRISMIGPVCLGSISGFGLQSYKLAVEYFIGSSV
jgi:3-dehydroquinate dehydratase-2